MSYPVKTKKVPNISKYAGYTPFIKMEKPKSAYCLWFILENPEDDWLVTMLHFKKKSGEITLDCMITQKDIARHVEIYEEDGYVRV